MCTAMPPMSSPRSSHSPVCKPGAHFDAQRLHRVANCHGAADRSLRAVERREEAVAGGVDLAAAKTGQLRPHDGVVRVEQRAPVAVTDLGRHPRRADDVGEQHRGEHAIVGHLRLVAGEELGDLLERISPRLDDVIHVAARQLNVFRAGNVIAEVPALRRRDDRVIGVLDDERGHADCGKHCPHVHLAHERPHDRNGPWARRQAFEPCPRRPDLLVPRHVRIDEVLVLARPPHGEERVADFLVRLTVGRSSQRDPRTPRAPQELWCEMGEPPRTAPQSSPRPRGRRGPPRCCRVRPAPP